MTTAKPVEAHSFTPDPAMDDELCLYCKQPHDHENHRESW